MDTNTNIQDEPLAPGEPTPGKPLISIDVEFEAYLNQVYGQNWNRMPPNQLLEIKRAFMGGMSTAFVRLVSDTANSSWTDEDITVRLKTIESALHKYWQFELEQHKQKQQPRIIT